MADKEITGLTDGGAPQAGDKFHAVRSGNSRMVTLGQRREVLTANRTYYVRTDGSDSNDGLANTSGGAFLSLQKAMDVIGGLDCSIYNVTVNVAAGTYTAGLTLKTFIGSGTVIFTGDTSNPSNVHVNVTSGNAFSSGTAVGNFTVQGFKWTSGNTQDFRVSSSCIVTSVSNEWAGANNYRIYVSAGGYLKLQGANNKISGGGIGFFLSESFGFIEDFGATFTITANLTYSGAFASCRSLARAVSLAIFTLGGFTVTGPRYSSTLNSVLVTSSSAGGVGGANHFPGNSAGSTATGGQYSG